MFWVDGLTSEAIRHNGRYPAGGDSDEHDPQPRQTALLVTPAIVARGAERQGHA